MTLGFDPGRLLRAARRHHKLSQRELAAIAGVPKSTVDRIESGATDPRVTTFAIILRSVGFQLAVTDPRGNPLQPDDDHDRLRDDAWRRFPAHLPTQPVTGEGDGWWGWRRIAWLTDDPKVPDRAYRRRRSDADRVPDGLGLDESGEPGGTGVA